MATARQHVGDEIVGRQSVVKIAHVPSADEDMHVRPQLILRVDHPKAQAGMTRIAIDKQREWRVSLGRHLQRRGVGAQRDRDQYLHRGYPACRASALTSTAWISGRWRAVFGVYLAQGDIPAQEVPPPPSPRKYWTRRGLAEWPVDQLAEDVPAMVGIEHGFSFPLRYFETHQLPPDWPTLLDDFQAH